MTPEETCAAVAAAVTELASHFMLAPDTYANAMSKGFEGMDFYVAGRGSALGDVPGDVVAAAFVFFNPETIVAAWDRTASLVPRHEAALLFAAAGHDWADTHLPDDLDCARLAELAGKVEAAASPAGAPIFAGWRTLPEPDADRPKALALHRMNALRELRMARHGGAVLAAGLSPQEALLVRTPYMAGLFGWAEPYPEVEHCKEAWAAAEESTDRAMSPIFAVLDKAERTELAEVANAARVATAR